MAGISIRLDASEAEAGLARLAAAGDDLTPLMRWIGATLEQSAQDRITITNTAPDGTPWPVSQRARINGGPTLLDTGRLRDSLSHVAGPESVIVGSNVEYARIHQLGGTIRAKSAGALRFALPDGGFAMVASVTLPPRPYLGVSDEDAGDIEALSLDFLQGAAEGGA